MPDQISRRRVLKRSAEVVAAGAAVTVLFNTADAAATQVPRDGSGATPGNVGTVVLAGDGTARVTLGTQELTLPVVGFPEGWQLRPGDQVSVGPDPDTATRAAQPLVTRLVGPIGKASQRSGRTVVTVAGTALVLDPATIRGGATARGGTGHYEAYYIQNIREATPRAVVLRPLQG